MTIKEKKLMSRLREINRVDNFNEHVEIMRELLYEREGILIFEGIDFHGGKPSDYFDDTDNESFSGLVFIDCNFYNFEFTECDIYDITFVNCVLLTTVFDLGKNYEDLYSLSVAGMTTFTYEDLIKIKELNKGKYVEVIMKISKVVDNSDSEELWFRRIEVNKILRLAQLKLKELKTEIAYLTYHSDGNNFEKIGMLYSKYFLVDSISKVARETSINLDNVEFFIKDSRIIDSILEYYDKLEQSQQNNMKDAVSSFIEDNYYISDSLSTGDIGSEGISKYFSIHESSLVLVGREISKIDLDAISNAAKGPVDLVLKDCSISSISANCFISKNVKLTIISSAIKSVNVVKSKFSCLITESRVSLNKDSFKGSRLNGGFIDNSVYLNAQSNSLDVDAVLCKVFNDVTSEIAYVKE